MASGDDENPQQLGGWSHGAAAQSWSRSQAGQHGGWAGSVGDDVDAQVLAGRGPQGRWGSEQGDVSPKAIGLPGPDRDKHPSREEQLRKLDNDYQLWRRERLRRFSDDPDRRLA